MCGEPRREEEEESVAARMDGRKGGVVDGLGSLGSRGEGTKLGYRVQVDQTTRGHYTATYMLNTE